jgi:hypothetical protein
MIHSKFTYYLQFLLIFSLLSLSNGAIACDVESGDNVLVAEQINSAVFSNSIHDFPSNHNEYTSEEKDEELEEENQGDIKEKTGKNVSSSILPETLGLRTLLSQKTTWSALKLYTKAHRYNRALRLFYCVFLC